MIKAACGRAVLVLGEAGVGRSGEGRGGEEGKPEGGGEEGRNRRDVVVPFENRHHPLLRLQLPVQSFPLQEKEWERIQKEQGGKLTFRVAASRDQVRLFPWRGRGEVECLKVRLE